MDCPSKCQCAQCNAKRAKLNAERARERLDRQMRRLAATPCGQSAPLPRVRKVERFPPIAVKVPAQAPAPRVVKVRRFDWDDLWVGMMIASCTALAIVTVAGAVVR